MDGDAYQILVHAGAPANRKDERHIQQAQNYQAATRWKRVEFDKVIETPRVESREAQSQQETSKASGPSLQRQLRLLEDTQLAYSELQSQLPLSSAPARISSAKRSTRKPPSSITSTNTRIPYSAAKRRHSLEPAQGQTKSSYLVTPIPHRSKRARLEGTAESPSRAQERHEAGRPPSQQDYDTHPQARDQASSGSCTFTTNETTSELPTSYSLSDIVSGGSKDRPQMPQRSTSDPGPQQLSDSLGHHRQLVEAEHGKSLSHSRPPWIAVPEADGKKPTEVRWKIALGENDLAMLHSIPMEIRPPVPKADVARFDTHVTQALAFLVNESPAANCYNPASISRAIEPWDRGHWRFNCSSWPVKRRVAFWQMLSNAIGDGTAGGDVWCTWAPEIQYSDETRASNPVGGHSFEIVRVYCWGEIVRHIYVLLYVASSSKVRHLGLQWLDAERKVVVQMPEESGETQKP